MNGQESSGNVGDAGDGGNISGGGVRPGGVPVLEHSVDGAGVAAGGIEAVPCARCGSRWLQISKTGNPSLVEGPGCSTCRAVRVAATSSLECRVPPELGALQKQVGGDHYRSMKIQPVEFIEANSLPFFEGCIIKYVARHAGKGGVDDLRKAKHYIDLILTLRYKETP